MYYNPPENCQVPELAQKWEHIFGCRSQGFFVEVGAFDGESFSNTSCLADVGWSGIYIEPIEEFAQQCRVRHAHNKGVKILSRAVSDFNGSTEIFIGGTLTTLVEEQVADYNQIDWAKGLHDGTKRCVQTQKLDDILDENGVRPGFDLLVVDVEGAEDRVMSGFDVMRWRPKALLIELEDEHPDFIDNHRVRTSARRVRDAVENAGYNLYFKDHINSLYVNSKDGNILTRIIRKFLPWRMS